MRNLLVVILLVCSNVFAQSIPITVIGEGRDVTQAKNNAFQKAIEQEVGVALLSHREVKNSKLATDEIITHSAGYVDDFKILNTEIINGVYYATVKVWVKSSRIQERILGATTDAKFANGDKINQQYESYNNTRVSGDEVLTAVLSSYPKSAFTVKVDKINKADMLTMVDRNRNPVFVMGFEVAYNYNFIRSLNEALKLTSDNRIHNHQTQQIISVVSKKPRSIFGDKDVYYINDTQRADLIKSAFITRVHVKMTALDGAGNPLFHGCQYIAGEESTILMNNKFTLNGNEKFENEVIITRKQGDPLIQQINSFTLTIHNGPC
jgi:hypothetical protein